MNFTELFIKNLKPKDKRFDLREKNGFAIRVTPNGTKSWIYMYKFQGRLRRITLGNYPLLSLSDARIKHMESYKLYKEGKDPAQIKQELIHENIKAPTIKELIDEYLEKWAKPRKKSWKKDQQILEGKLKPWFHRKAQSITRRDIILLLESMQKKAPIGANRALAAIRRMFNFSVERDILPHSPCISIKALSRENKRERFLSENEIKLFWHSLKASTLVKLALKMQLITAQRKAEILTMEWTDIDFETGWWNLPGAKTKNGRSHRAPLSSLAIEILEEVKKLPRESKYVFSQHEKPLEGASLSRVIRRSQALEPLSTIPPFTPHDLRRTAATHMSSFGVDRLIISKILNHVESSVTAIYDRHTYDNEKKKALDKWDEKLKQIIGIYDGK